MLQIIIMMVIMMIMVIMKEDDNEEDDDEPEDIVDTYDGLLVAVLGVADQGRTYLHPRVTPCHTSSI